MGYSSRPTTAMSSRSGGMSSRPGTAMSMSGRSVDDARRSLSARRAPGEPAEFLPVVNQRSQAEEMEQRWIARRHEEIITKQRDEESAALMGEWEKRRVHLEEEAVRNQEASRFASVLERRAENRPQAAPPKVVDVSQPRASKPPLAPKTNLELEALAKIRKLNSHLLHTSGETAPERD